jgi:excisionase family DNA binding protein
MQGHRTLPAKTPAASVTLGQRRASRQKRTLAEFVAAGELTCSAADVARWLNVSKPTVIADARCGKLPGRQVGRQWRFSCMELARMWGLTPEGGGVDVA